MAINRSELQRAMSQLGVGFVFSIKVVNRTVVVETASSADAQALAAALRAHLPAALSHDVVVLIAQPGTNIPALTFNEEVVHALVKVANKKGGAKK